MAFTSITQQIKHVAQRFWNDTKGVVSIEMVIFLPLLFWTFASVAVFFDAFRTRSLADKAAFTISDMLSRETTAITDTYINNTQTLFDDLASSHNASSLRVSVISWNSSREAHEVDWSEVRGSGLLVLDNSNIEDLATRLPLMSSGDTLILVETANEYRPLLDVGLGNISIDTFVFTRPRYAPQLVFESA